MCLNPEQQERDAIVREQMLSSLKQKIEHGNASALIGNSGYRRYLKVDSKNLHIDESKAYSESRYDGICMLMTNSGLPTNEAALAYNSLWQVERAFRELKTGLEMRPVRHYADRRIRGHVMVCFLALVLEMVMRCKIRQMGEDGIRWDDMMQSLTEVSAVEVTLGEKRYLTRTEAGALAQLAFRAVGLRPPERVREIGEKATESADERSGTSQPSLFTDQREWPFC